jgi:hypothetical protein
LAKYDIILGMDWMEEVEHCVNYKKKRLRIGPRGGKAQSLIQGLTAKDAEQYAGSRVDRKPVLQQISLDTNPDDDVEILVAEIVSEEEFQSDCAAIWTELSNAETSPDLNEFEKRIRMEYPDLFEEPSGLPPERKSGGFRIRLIPGAQPTYRSPYRMTPAELDEYRRQILALRDRRAVRRSKSPYAAPAIFVPKPGSVDPKTGKPKLRMVYDYRFLNRITVKDRFPLPLPEDLLNRLQGSRFFSKIDFFSSYHQHRMHPDDIEKTAFMGPDGLWEWLVMPFGLTNAPAEFMRLMYDVLKKHIDKGYCIVYLDDILIYSKTAQEHDRHVRAILDTLRKEGFRLGSDKCEFGRARATFLGFEVDGQDDAIKMTAAKVRAVADWPYPTTPTEMRKFVGLTGVYRRFVPDFARLVLPLLSLITVDQRQFDNVRQDTDGWKRVCAAVDMLKAAIIARPALALPKAGCQYLVRTDASDFAIGGTLRQLQDDPDGKGRMCERILAYFSRKLLDAETRYSTYDKELLAVRDAITHWRYYLHGNDGGKFIVRTDHSSLQHILKQPKLTSRQMRLLETLQEYDFDIEYWPGAKNYVQDALSRRPDYKEPPIPRLGTKQQQVAEVPDAGEILLAGVEQQQLLDPRLVVRQPLGSDAGLHQEDLEVENMMATVAIQAGEWLDRVRDAYKSDGYFDLVWEELTGEPEDAEKTSAERHKQRRDRAKKYYLEDGLIYDKIQRRLCVPKVLQMEVIEEAHNSTTGGHFGTDRTEAMVASRFYWKGLRPMVRRYVQGCEACQRAKPPNHKPYGLLQPLDIPEERWKRINIDFITKLPTTEKGNDTIITFVDGLTKRAHWVATTEKTLTAKKFAQLFVEHYFRLHGIPDDIVSDRDARFTSEFWEHLTTMWKTKLKMSTAFHPQTDGQAEKANSIVERYLRTFAANDERRWDDLLPLAEFSYNAHTHKSLGMTPFEADLCYTPRTPLDMMTSGVRQAKPGHGEEAVSFVTTMQDNLRKMRAVLLTVQETQREQANKTRQAHTFQPGDKVMISTKNMPLTYAAAAAGRGEEARLSSALRQKFLGPYTLGERRGENAFDIPDLPSHLRIHRTQNVALFKRYIPGMPDQPQEPPPPVRVLKSGAAEYELERIVAWKYDENDDDRLKLLIKWKGEPESASTWEPPTNLSRYGGAETLKEWVDAAPDYVMFAHLLPKAFRRRREGTRSSSRLTKGAEQPARRGGLG